MPTFGGKSANDAKMNLMCSTSSQKLALNTGQDRAEWRITRHLLWITSFELYVCRCGSSWCACFQARCQYQLLAKINYQNQYIRWILSNSINPALFQIITQYSHVFSGGVWIILSCFDIKPGIKNCIFSKSWWKYWSNNTLPVLGHSFIMSLAIIAQFSKTSKNFLG